MKLGFKKHRYSWFAIFCLAAILAVVVCNVWLFSCGRCVASDFLQVTPIGWMILSANLAAGIVLFILKKRPAALADKNSCSSCHSALRDQWPYCPTCGSSR